MRYLLIHILSFRPVCKNCWFGVSLELSGNFSRHLFTVLIFSCSSTGNKNEIKPPLCSILQKLTKLQFHYALPQLLRPNFVGFILRRTFISLLRMHRCVLQHVTLLHSLLQRSRDRAINIHLKPEVRFFVWNHWREHNELNERDNCVWHDDKLSGNVRDLFGVAGGGSWTNGTEWFLSRSLLEEWRRR